MPYLHGAFVTVFTLAHGWLMRSGPASFPLSWSLMRRRRMWLELEELKAIEVALLSLTHRLGDAPWETAKYIEAKAKAEDMLPYFQETLRLVEHRYREWERANAETADTEIAP